MTPARQPHQQRCETCDYFPAGSIFDERCPYSRYTWRHAGNHPQCIKDPWLASDIWQIPIDVMSELTSDIGCASHSSTQAPERLCDECNIIELEEKLMHLEQDLKDARKSASERVERVLESIHKKTLRMRHRASSEEVNNEAVVLDYSAVYELLQSLRAQQEQPSTKGGAP